MMNFASPIPSTRASLPQAAAILIFALVPLAGAAQDGLVGDAFPIGRYGVGDVPADMRMGDVDGDGEPDLVVGHSDLYSAAAVDILFGAGDGTFREKVSLEFGPHGSCYNLALGDLDADGDLDIAAAVSGGQILVRLNRGGRMFDTATSVAQGVTAHDLGAFDATGDGHLDLVFLESGDDVIMVAAGDGLGSFGPPASIPGSEGATELASGDLDGDGRMDLAFARLGFPELRVLFGESQGAWTSLILPIDQFATQVVIADGTGDGVPEILALQRGTRSLYLLENLGNRTMAPAESFIVEKRCAYLDVADMNGDGQPDFLITHRSSQEEEAGSLSVVAGQNGRPGATQLVTSVGDRPRQLVSSDFNHDGFVDVAIVNYIGDDVAVVTGGIDFGLEVPYVLPTLARPRNLGAGDFDGDGTVDLIVNGSSSVSVLHLGRGDGTFLPMGPLIPGVGMEAGFVEDVNGDGLPDWVGVPRYVGSSAGVALNLGGGRFSLVSTSSIFRFEERKLGFGDLDGDGRTDLAGSPYFRVLRSFLVQSDGTMILGPAGENPAPVDCVAVGDLDGDGRADLVAGHRQLGTVWTHLHASGGGFVHRSTLGPIATGPYQLGTGDVDGDGLLDVIVSGWDTGDFPGRLVVLRGLGNGELEERPSTRFKNLTLNIEVADINLDGRADVIGLGLGDASDVDLYLGQADGTLRYEGSYPAREEARAVAIADFDGDGNPDLAVANDRSRDVSIFMSRAGQRIDTYCVSSVNSTGAAGHIGGAGRRGSPAGGFRLSASGLPPGEVAMFFSGAVEGDRVLPGGTLCVAGPLTRAGAAIPVGPSGTIIRSADLGPYDVGSTRFFQCWYTDAAGAGRQFMFTDAVAVLVGP